MAQDAGEGFYLREELGVAEPLFGVGYWAVVEDSGLVAVAGENVPVNAVVACGELAVREPFPV